MNKAVKTVGFIAFATLLAKAAGMFRDIVLAHSYGTSSVLDAYMAASRIPVLFFDFTLGAAIISTFIPVYNRYLQKNEEDNAAEFSNSFINLTLIVSALFCVLGVLFSKWLIGVMAPGFSADTKIIASKLLVIMLPSIIFTTLAFSVVGILQSLGEFNIPAIISLVSNAAVIFYLMFLNKYFGIYGLAVAMLVGWGLQVLVQIPSLIKKKYRYTFVLNLKNPGIKDVFVMALPVLVSSWLQPICVLVNTVFGSYLETGSVAALEFANRLYIIVVGIFVFAITNYIFPALSKLSGGGDRAGFSGIMNRSMASMMIIIVPITAGIMLLSKEIITIVYARGQFGDKSIYLTGTALFFYSIGMPFYGTNEILSKCFYAQKDGKTPMIASLTGVFCAVLFAFVFTNLLGLGIGGLALGASLATMIVSIILIYSMNKKTHSLIGKKSFGFLGRVLAAAVVSICAAAAIKWLTARCNVWINTFAAVIAAIPVYFAVLYILKANRYFSSGKSLLEGEGNE